MVKSNVFFYHCVSEINVISSLQVAQELVNRFSPDFPVLIDTIANTCSRQYRAYPERLYIILDGLVVFKGGMGPQDYKIDAVEAWLKEHSHQ